MARTTGRKKSWGRDTGDRPGHRKDSLRGPGRGAGSDFQSRPWGGDRGNVHGQQSGERAPGMKGQRAAPEKESRPQDHSMSPKDYRGRTDYGVTDDRPGGFANHTDEHDPRAKSYHRLGGTSSAGFQFKGVRGY